MARLAHPTQALLPLDPGGRRPADTGHGLFDSWLPAATVGSAGPALREMPGTDAAGFPAERAASAIRRSTAPPPITRRAVDNPAGNLDALRRSRSDPAGAGHGQREPTRRPIGAAGDTMPLRRRLSKTGRDIAAVRSRAGRLKGAVSTSDTLSRLGIVLDGYQREREPDRQQRALTVILGLCRRYLDDNAGATKDDKQIRVELVEDIQAEAARELGQLKAQQRYLTDAYGGSDAKTPLKAQRSTNLTHHVAKALGRGQTVSDVAGGTAQTLAMAREFGLTEAEILAIRTTTVDDYRYIHPVTAQDSSWLDFQVGQMSGGATGVPDRKVLQQEGSLQSGVAMMGLDKLPPVSQLLYRGMRLTQADYDATIGVGTYRTGAITSTSGKVAQARSYVQGGSAQQNVAILLEIEVTNGRDIAHLSNYAVEAEVVLLPGAEFHTIRSVDDPTLAKSNPDITVRKKVRMKQVK